MANTLQLDIGTLNGQLTNSEKNTIINKITKSVQTNQYSDIEVQEFINSNIIETNKFTKHLYVNIVTILKNEKLFLKLLKSEDDQLISDTIRKCIYFYENDKYSPKFYCDDIFPYISMKNRKLLIQTLAKNLKNPQTCELFFNHLNLIFGISMARPFFIYCSDEFIMEKLNKNILIANYHELNIILPRKAKFILNYLRRMIEINDDKNLKCMIQLSLYDDLLLKLLGIHPTETIELIVNNKEKISLDFGRKLTKKLLKLSKESILKDVKHYVDKLHMKMIFKKLSKEDFNLFFEKLYPNYLKDFNRSMTSGTLHKYLNYYKRNSDKVNLLITSYKNVYRQDLFDYSKNLTPDFLKLLAKEDRIKLANEIINKGDETYLKIDQWRCYADCKLTVQLFKEQIQITSDCRLRQKYLIFMIESCGINDDFDTLLDVLKYFNKRHRNEIYDVRQNFLISINNHINLDKMVNEHWMEFFEICDIMSLNNEYRNLWQCNTLFLKQLKYYLNNNLSIDKSIQVYIKWVDLNQYGGQNKWAIFDKNKNWEKLCLQKFGALIPLHIQNFTYGTAEIYFSAIASWNKRNPNDLMSIIDYPWVVSEITKNLNLKNQGSYYYKRLLNNFKYDPKAVEYFGDKIPSDEECFDINKLNELILKEPEWVKINIDKISEYILHHPIKQIEHLNKLLIDGKFRKIPGLEDAVHKICLENINTEDENKLRYRSTALYVLIYWLNADEFYEIVRNNYPEEKRLETGNKLVEYQFQFQSEIVSLMKFYYNHSETFIALKKFCVGDFLKLTIGPLQSICLRSPLYKSLDFLNSCIDTPVSFRKHIIRLICRIADKQFIYQFLQKLWYNENNPSIRQVLFDNIIQLFISEPDDIKWHLVKECIESLTDKDQPCFELINCFVKIHDDYLANYIEISWLVLNKAKNEIQKELMPLKRNILSEMTKNINLMPTKLIETIIIENLFSDKIDTSLHYNFTELAIAYILNASTDNDHKLRIDFVFKLLKQFFTTKWNQIQYDENNENPYFEARKYIKEFLNNIIMELLADIEKFKIKKFILSYLPMQLIEIIPDASSCIYEELLQYEILNISIKYINCFDFGKDIRNLLDNEIKKYGNYIIPIFANVVEDFGSMSKYFSVYEMCEGLLAEPIEPIQSNQCALLILHLISCKDLYNPNYRGLLERLLIIEDPKIKIIFNKFVK